MNLKDKIKNFPEKPGVYLMENKKGEIIYVGKAANLKKRVSSYFLKAHDARIEKLISEIFNINYFTTQNVLEALILESNLIKKYKPKYNIKEKDDKSFLYVLITKEKYPRVILVRGKEINNFKGKFFGPFVSASSIREALKIIRKIFPYNLHSEKELMKLRPCLDYQIGLCPGACAGKITPQDYKKNIIKNISLIFEGKLSKLIKKLKKEMMEYSNKLDFEKAEKIKRQIFALEHIKDVSLISQDDFYLNQEKKQRIEGYDISNISGDWATGSMVVFYDGKPQKSEYKKFKIKNVKGINDVAMLKEILERRFRHKEWELPDIILIDGGKSQVNIAKNILKKMNLNIPVVGIAKGPKRKNNDFYGDVDLANKNLMIKVRDEAHRFALKYHRFLRKKIL
jgi:excinuclease ABC subunit C